MAATPSVFTFLKMLTRLIDRWTRRILTVTKIPCDYGRMEEEGDVSSVLSSERQRFRRVLDVLFDRYFRTRRDAYKELAKENERADNKNILQALLSRSSAISTFEDKELRDIRFLLEQLRVLLDSKEDPSSWPANPIHNDQS